uniref:Uncharacterized protein n=1 Tax=Anguilla anguilla TaxID=7936 RepID=A0A0E9UI03_ANGAN
MFYVLKVHKHLMNRRQNQHVSQLPMLHCNHVFLFFSRDYVFLTKYCTNNYVFRQ